MFSTEHNNYLTYSLDKVMELEKSENTEHNGPFDIFSIQAL